YTRRRPAGRSRDGFRVFGVLDVVLGAEEMDEQRHHEKDGDDGGEHASYHDARQRLLGLSAYSVREGSGTEAQSGCHAGHHYRAHFVAAAFLESGVKALFGLGATDPRKEDDGSQSGHSSQRGKADGRGNAEIGAGEEQGQHAPDGTERQGAEHDERVFPGAELDIEQNENRYQAYGNDEGETALLLAQAV